MLQIAQTLSQLALLDQFKASERISSDFKAWVANQNYYIDDELVDKNFSLRIVNDDFFKSIGYDCDKFTRTSIETIAAIQQNRIFKKNSSWPIISAYYAAFFAAHAILRAFGVSFSQLSSQHMQKIWRHAQMFGKSGGLASLTSGFYKVTFDSSTSNLSFQWMKDSHADLWNSFLQLLQMLINKVPDVSAISQDKLDVMNLLSDIKHAIMQRGAAGNWLSMMRNEVNYQHAYGSWYPYSDGNFNDNVLLTEPKKLLSQNNSIQLVDSISNLNSVFNTSLRITNLMISLVKVCNQKFSNKNYNFNNGSLKMINILET